MSFRDRGSDATPDSPTGPILSHPMTPALTVESVSKSVLAACYAGMEGWLVVGVLGRLPSDHQSVAGQESRFGDEGDLYVNKD